MFITFANLLMLTGLVFMLRAYGRALASRSDDTLFMLFSLVEAVGCCSWLLKYYRGWLCVAQYARLKLVSGEFPRCVYSSSCMGCWIMSAGLPDALWDRPKWQYSKDKVVRLFIEFHAAKEMIKFFNTP